MRLYLVQHGDAVAKDIDPGRPLSGLGERDIRKLAHRFEESGVKVGRILHSGKLRARQTAEILKPLLVAGGTVEARDGLAPNDSPETLLESLGDEDVLVAGHMPFVSRGVSLALGLPPQHTVALFQPGSAAVLEHADGRWQLVAFLRPENV